jgi:hypothetical protein
MPRPRLPGMLLSILKTDDVHEKLPILTLSYSAVAAIMLFAAYLIGYRALKNHVLWSMKHLGL